MLEQALSAAQEHGVEDLGFVHNISRRDFDGRVTFRFRTQVPCMEYLSLLIENAVLLRTNRAGRVYAGFEKLSHMEAIADRYLRMADLSERVYVFGEADWLPPRHPNMRAIAVSPNCRLAREWFVITCSATMHVALVGFDERWAGAMDSAERQFSAFKSSDPAVVMKLAEVAEGLVDASLAA
jgi:DICT domain-containing protein